MNSSWYSGRAHTVISYAERILKILIKEKSEEKESRKIMKHIISNPTYQNLKFQTPNILKILSICY